MDPAPLIYESCGRFLEQTRGNPQFILFQKLKILKRNLKEWNRVSFGNLKLKIAAAEEKVLQAQLQLDS